MQVTPVVANDSFPGSFWEWRGQSIYYVKAGEGKPNLPPLLLIHGFGASTDHWRKNIAQLQEYFQVWAIDLLGFGRSGKPNWEYSGNLWRDQLSDFITEVIGQPVILAGNSLGGYAALCVASQCPEKARGLILLNSAGPFTDTKIPVKVSPFQRLRQTVTRSIVRQPWITFLMFQNLRRRSVIRKTLQKVYLDSTAVTDRLVEEIYRPSCDKGAATVFASVFKSPQGEKVDVLLGQLKCPLLLLWGEKDPWMNARDRSEKFRQFYPQLTEHFLNAGHCPHDEIPEQINALIQEWVIAVNSK